MGGADFVQWHGNYPLLKHEKEIQEMAEQLRRVHGKN
jgi:hydroxylamine dehydrogenase